MQITIITAATDDTMLIGTLYVSLFLIFFLEAFFMSTPSFSFYFQRTYYDKSLDLKKPYTMK
jgi:hypothetical protein